MPQTLLAVLALMIAMLLSFNMQREVVQSQQDMIKSEVEVMATGMALQAMEIIRTRHFDEAVAKNDSMVHTKSEFEPHPFQADNGFGYRCRSFFGGTGRNCNDLDDFRNMRTATLTFDMLKGSMDFAVDVEVHYMEENPSTGEMERTTSNTYQKEVIVRVQDVPEGDRSPFLRDSIELSRTFSYDFMMSGDDDDSGGGQGEFEELWDWVDDQLSNAKTRAHLKNWAKDHGYNTLAGYIKNRNLDGIKNWMQDHDDVRDALIDYWGGQDA